MPKSQLDWLGVVTLWLGAAIMAIKAGNLPVMAGAPDWLTADFWSYVPIVLVTIYPCLAIYRLLNPSGAATTTARPAAKELTAKPRREKEPREILPDSIVRAYLSLVATGPTSLQLVKFLTPYAGDWMELELELVSLETSLGKLRAQCAHEVDGKRHSSIFAYFDHKWEDHLHHTNRGDLFKFVGKIRIPGYGAPDFVDAEPL